MFYSPRLRSYIKMAWFRVGLVNRLCGEYTRSLEQQVVVVDQEVEEESGLEPDITSDEVKICFHISHPSPSNIKNFIKLLAKKSNVFPFPLQKASLSLIHPCLFAAGFM